MSEVAFQERRTGRTLSDTDLEALAGVLQSHHACRFSRVSIEDIEDMTRVHHEIKPEDLREAVKFYTNFNNAMRDSKKTVRSLIVTLGFTTVVGLIAAGIWVEIRTKLGIN